jgi:hypothetical protein
MLDDSYAAAKAENLRPALFLLDIIVPGGDGFDLCRPRYDRMPRCPRQNEKIPDIGCCPPFGGVKEQSAGIYARRMADSRLLSFLNK